MNTEEITPVEVSDLAFDIKNPRLSEFDLSASCTDEEMIRLLWDAMDVEELVFSIAASGFFRHEPLIVAREDGKNIVIEGNRRLAAVQVLLDPELAQTLNLAVTAISEQARNALLALPTIQGTRETAWRYLGFKHVNGPAKWSSYAKARYVADVNKNFDVPLEEIARQIGDTHKTVQRLYRGLMVIEQAERLKVFDRRDRWRNHFSFSHLYTGLDYEAISNFIGLKSATEEVNEPVPIERKGELEALCLWLYGSKKEGKAPIVEKQNPHLRMLAAVVKERESLVTLRVSSDLEYAFEVSRPSSNVFEESLLESKINLEKARRLLSSGYDGSEQLLRIADAVATLASDLVAEMDRKRNSAVKSRASENS